MKHVVLAGAFVFLFVQSTAAATYSVECLDSKGKFSSCTVGVQGGTLSIRFKGKKHRDFDRDIPGASITALSSGEYARRRVAESIGFTALLGPLFLFALFSKKKRDHIGVEYVLDGQKQATMFEVKKKYGSALKMELEAISGKVVQEQEPGERKTNH